MLLDVRVLSPKSVIFEGRSKSVKLPGEAGVFEILPFHKNILSRLIGGVLFVDEKQIRIRRGIVKAGHNDVTIIIEQPQ